MSQVKRLNIGYPALLLYNLCKQTRLNSPRQQFVFSILPHPWHEVSFQLSITLHQSFYLALYILSPSILSTVIIVTTKTCIVPREKCFLCEFPFPFRKIHQDLHGQVKTLTFVSWDLGFETRLYLRQIYKNGLKATFCWELLFAVTIQPVITLLT